MSSRRWSKIIAIAFYSLLATLGVYLLAKANGGWIILALIALSQLAFLLGYFVAALNMVPKNRFLNEMFGMVEASLQNVVIYLQSFQQQSDRIEARLDQLSLQFQAHRIQTFNQSAQMHALIERLQTRKAIDPNKQALHELLLLMSQAQFKVSSMATQSGVCPCCGFEHENLKDEELFHRPIYHEKECPIPAAMDLAGNIESAVSPARA